MTKHPKVMNHELSQLRWGGEKYDFIGDIHGCYNTLTTLLENLNYKFTENGVWIHPEGRIPVFLGDLVDRGSMSYQVLVLVMKMLKLKVAKYVPGNHCNKLFRYLRGNNVRIGHALKQTLLHFEEEKRNDPILYKETIEFFINFVENCKYHIILDKGNVIAVHAAIDAENVGVYNKKTKEKNIYGFVNTDIRDEYGRPLRIPTHDVYKGDSLVLHGHIANEEPLFKNNVLDIDTGCGLEHGKLTAYRYPEGNFVSVKVIDSIDVLS